MTDKRNISPFAKIGEILVADGSVTEEQLKKSINEQQYTHEKLGDLLIKLGYAVEEQVFSALAHQNGLDFITNERKLAEYSASARKLARDQFSVDNLYKLFEKTVLAAV